MSAPIVLLGFMGTGKTTVGKILAKRLKCRFVDSDDIIEEKAGSPIPEIFARQGEAAFRRMEKAVIAELAREQDIIIAAGGGAVLNNENLHVLRRHGGTLFVLTASVDDIIARTEHSDRPLLQGKRETLKQRIEYLLSQRQALYDTAGRQIKTSFKSAEEVADEIVRLLRGGSSARQGAMPR